MPDDRPNFLEMLTSVVRAPFEERHARAAQARFEAAQYDATAHVMQEVVRRVRDDEDGWIPITDDLQNRDLDAGQATSLRDAARVAARARGHARGYLGTLRRFVLGRGVQFDPQIDDESLRDKILAWWGRFVEVNDWDALEDQLLYQLLRDGEFFLRGFAAENDDQGIDIGDEVERALRSTLPNFDVQELDEPDVPEGMLELRLVPPEQIVDPTGTVTHGVLTKKDDVQTVYGYLWCPDGTQVREVVPVRDMMHVKINVDLDVKRGRSELEPILDRQRQYDDWLRYRVALSLARTAVVWVKTIKGTPAQLANIRTAQEKQLTDPSNDRKQRMLKPMSTVHATEGIQYEFKSPDLQAQDARHDGRQIQLAMAVATGLAEHFFTADASNANYSSTLAAQTPTIRVFEDWQDTMTPVYRRIFRWVIETAIRHRAIEGIDVEEFRRTEVQVSYPPMVVRDEATHTEANERRAKGGILSKRGWAESDGVDWEREKERLAAEFEEELGLSPIQALPAIDRILAAGGLTPDANLEAWLRKVLGIPSAQAEEPDDDAEREE